MPVISWLPTGKGETKEEWIDVTVNGAVYETVTLTASDGTTSECVTDANGKGTAAVKVGQTYTLIGGVSGYEKTVNVESNTESIKVMLDWALYWYGNECTEVTGGLVSVACTNYTLVQPVFDDNNILLKITSTPQQSDIVTSNKINFSGYNKLCCEMEVSGVDGTNVAGGLRITSVKDDTMFANLVANAGQATYSGIYNIDVSNITTDNYVLITCHRMIETGESYIKVKKIWLE